MIRRPPRSTRTDTLFPTRRSSDLVQFVVVEGERAVHEVALVAGRVVVAGADRHVGGLAFVNQRRRLERRAALPLLDDARVAGFRSEEHTSELQSLMRISYAVFCLKKKKSTYITKLEINSSNT